MVKAKNEPRYAEQLRALQIGLTALQRGIIEDGRKVLVIVEGRDAAGKDGTIKRVVEHLSPRETRVVALGPHRITIAGRGISSAGSLICRLPARSCCSIVAGTIAPGWSA